MHKETVFETENGYPACFVAILGFWKVLADKPHAGNSLSAHAFSS